MKTAAAQININNNFLRFSSPSSTKPAGLFPSSTTTATLSSLGCPPIKNTPFLGLVAIRPLSQKGRLPVSKQAAKANRTGEQKWTHEGSITESLPNGMFRVRLDNEDVIIGYISGKIRKNFVRILPGDRVKVEVSRYDSSRGRIVYRLRNKASGGDD
uniref:Translation initiation factor IF-1, chloroplastic n=1 Tax=Rhizophora mucronata TaxID=61149 RepID=A0A2P2NIV2_RHIMU